MVLGGFRSFHVLVTTHTLSVLKGHDDRVEPLGSNRGDFGIIIFQYSIILFPLNVNVK